VKVLSIGISALLISSLLSSCSAVQEGVKEGINSADYTEAMKASFMSGCQQAAEKERDAATAKKYCECTFERVSSTIPVEEYTKLDMGQEMSPEAKLSLNVAVTQCGGKASNL
jgi:hypothetical protein